MFLASTVAKSASTKPPSVVEEAAAAVATAAVAVAAMADNRVEAMVEADMVAAAVVEDMEEVKGVIKEVTVCQRPSPLNRTC